MRSGYLTILLASIFIGSAFAQNAHQTVSNRTTPTKSPEPIQLSVTVTGKKGLVISGIKQSDFKVSIEKKPATVVSFSDEERPISIGIVIDASTSARGHSPSEAQANFETLREAIGKFLELSNQSNEYFLLGFNARPQLLVDWTSNATKVVDGLKAVNVGNDSAFYDACYLAIDKLQRSHHDKRVLILLSDGLDNISHYTFRELRELLQKSEVLLYAVHFPRSDTVGSTMEMEGEGILSELSSLSGGVAINGKRGNPLRLKDAQIVFETIAYELRHQYTISVIPNESTEGRKWRKIKVKIDPPPEADKEMKNLTARTREGFY